MRPGCQEEYVCDNKELVCTNVTACHMEAACTIQNGLLDCFCKTGYRGNGRHCEGTYNVKFQLYFIRHSIHCSIVISICTSYVLEPESQICEGWAFHFWFSVCFLSKQNRFNYFNHSGFYHIIYKLVYILSEFVFAYFVYQGFLQH